MTFKVAPGAGKWDEGTAKVQVPTRHGAIPWAEPLRNRKRAGVSKSFLVGPEVIAGPLPAQSGRRLGLPKPPAQ